MSVKMKVSEGGSLEHNEEYENPAFGSSENAFYNPRMSRSTSKGLTYTWSNIDVFAKDSENSGRKFSNCFKKGSVENGKQILNQVTGVAKPNQLLALMGSSGAGKTTLLNVLTCRNTGKLKISGERLINGVPVDRNMLSTVGAYIQQNDIFIGTLTPREHLIFHATLRMDQKIPLKRRMERVEEVIREMGLTACADVIIGIPGRVKGISGGQQKRLAIATEVLTDPGILFCDEPTTGLDSFMAQSIVKSLKALAAQGKTIICTIHQPASEVFALFDRLFLMSEGRTAFMGDPQDALEFFATQGFPSPKNYNPADFFIFTLAIRVGSEQQCKEKCLKICNEFESTELAQEVQNSVEKNRAQYAGENVFTQSPYKASWWTQFMTCLWRSWKTVLKDPLVLKVQLGQTLFLSILMGLIFLNQDMDQEGIQNINGFIFMLLANLTFSSVFPVANVFWNELPVFMREHYNGTYRTDVYYLAKTLAEIPIYICMPAIFISIAYWMIGMNPGADRFLFAIVVVILISNVASSYGYMISTMSSSLEMALGLAPVFIMPFLLFGGSMMNKDSIPVYFIWLKYLSWFLHGNEALSINQWVGIQNINCNHGNASCMSNGDIVLENSSFKEENFGLSLGVLGAMIVGVRILSYLGLLAKTRKED